MKVNIAVPCLKSNLQHIRKFVVDVLREQHLSEVEVHSLVLAVDEVCANLMIHANQCSPDHSIEVFIDIKAGDKVIFDILDKGHGFDIREHPEPDLEDIIHSRKKGGVGLMLVKRIMDDIDFIHKDGFSIVRLIKNLKSSS